MLRPCGFDDGDLAVHLEGAPYPARLAPFEAHLPGCRRCLADLAAMVDQEELLRQYYALPNDATAWEAVVALTSGSPNRIDHLAP